MDTGHGSITTWATVAIFIVMSISSCVMAENYEYGGDDGEGSFIGIRCYKCTGTKTSNPGCMYPFQKEAATVCQDGDSCLVFTSTTLGETSITRGCHKTDRLVDTAVCEEAKVGGHTETQSCYCFRDLCNGARPTGGAVKKMYTVLAICFSMLLAVWNSKLLNWW